MSRRAGGRVAGVVSAALYCGGCSTVVPALPEEAQLSVSSVVKGVQCEMKEAVIRATEEGRRTWLEDWEAAYAITLNVTETGSVRASGGTPITTPNVLVGLSAGAGALETRRRIAKVNFVAKLSEVRGYYCSGYGRERGHPFVPGQNLGRAGLSDWLNRALDAVDPAGNDDLRTPSARRPASVGHTFEFIVQVDANTGAGFALLPAGGATFSPSGAMSRTDDHSLEMTFAPPKTVVKTIKVKETVITPGRAPTPEETKELGRLKATTLDLAAQLTTPEQTIQGFNTLDLTEQRRRKTEIALEIARSKEEAGRIEDRLKPRKQTITVPRTIVETSPSSAQEALMQLQFERLLSVPRF